MFCELTKYCEIILAQKIVLKLSYDRLWIGPLACIRDPAFIGDPSSIRTSSLDPRLVLETRLIFETWLLLVILRYLTLWCNNTDVYC